MLGDSKKAQQTVGLSAISIHLKSARATDFSTWLVPLRSVKNSLHVATVDRLCAIQIRFVLANLLVLPRGTSYRVQSSGYQH